MRQLGGSGDGTRQRERARVVLKHPVQFMVSNKGSSRVEDKRKRLVNRIFFWFSLETSTAMAVKNLALLVAMAMAVSAVKIGDNMPGVSIHSSFGPPTDVDIAARVADKVRRVALYSLDTFGGLAESYSCRPPWRVHPYVIQSAGPRLSRGTISFTVY